MTAPQAVFGYMAAASIASAALAVTRPNPVHSLLWVLVLFLHVAGIYLLLGAEFLAVVQVIVYAGAILVFYLLVMMLLDLSREEQGRRFGRHWPLGAAAALGLAALIWSGARFGGGLPARLPRSVQPPSLAALGRALYGHFALPFEIASLVLLAAIVGAVVLARRRIPG